MPEEESVLVWDGNVTLPLWRGTIILWNDFNNFQYPSALSIPQWVEDHADSLRSQYLAWVFDLGETVVQGKRLIDQLTLRPEFSYWWMTLLVEKSWYKSPRLYDAIRLLAFEKMLEGLRAKKVFFVSCDGLLAHALKKYCHGQKLLFEWKKIPGKQGEEFLSLRGRIFRWLPLMGRAIAWLGHFLWERRWFFVNLQKNNNKDFLDLLVVDYLIHLNVPSGSSGRFESNYWTALVAAIRQTKIKVNYLHIFSRHKAVPSDRDALTLAHRFNANGGSSERHLIWDNMIDVFVVVAALKDYFRIMVRGWRLRQIKNYFHPRGSGVDFWPVLKSDWIDSMFGPTALWNCFALNLFEKMMRSLPPQKQGIYLMENHGWEMAFIHAWRANRHGELIGVSHSTVRYWDLRYFQDSRIFKRHGANNFPMPDKVALNGPEALRSFEEEGYPSEQLAETEALRYLYLESSNDCWKQNHGRDKGLTILVCGDHSPEVTVQMLQWLEAAASALPKDAHILLKLHPACLLKTTSKPHMTLHLTEAPLMELLKECDVAFTSNLTSAAVDVYYAGVPLIQALDGNMFNMSPLRGKSDVVYVRSSVELSKALVQVRPRTKLDANSFFYLDQKIPRWRRLLHLESDITDTKNLQ